MLFFPLGPGSMKIFFGPFLHFDLQVGTLMVGGSRTVILIISLHPKFFKVDSKLHLKNFSPVFFQQKWQGYFRIQASGSIERASHLFGTVEII